VAVIRASDAPGTLSLSQAAEGPTKWTIGASLEFQTRSDGLQSFNGYHLPMATAVRATQPEALFPAFSKGELNMVVMAQTDSHLTQAEWRVLEDDQNRSAPQQGVLLVKQSSLKQQPKLGAALQELSGKLTLEVMRRLNAEVDLKERPVPEVAAEFLRSVGL
jgi:osmoprotectant transport system substrate-binding protein